MKTVLVGEMYYIITIGFDVDEDDDNAGRSTILSVHKLNPENGAFEKLFNEHLNDVKTQIFPFKAKQYTIYEDTLYFFKTVNYVEEKTGTVSLMKFNFKSDTNPSSIWDK